MHIVFSWYVIYNNSVPLLIDLKLVYVSNRDVDRRIERTMQFSKVKPTFNLENCVEFMLVDWSYFLTGVLLFIFIIYIREISWKHDASMSIHSVINKGINIEGCKISIGSEPINKRNTRL